MGPNPETPPLVKKRSGIPPFQSRSLQHKLIDSNLISHINRPSWRLDYDGLPVGLQLVGRRYADADVLLASAVFEMAQPWAQYYAELDASASS